ncbi:PDZ and LIM domain protein Zasp isoform X1 [Rhagoletis pomonella]|uniref:PDZ and LIM domain protein Zasp isoform X1 n=1 Tax=Rhagoletis pomonella TaxID=28610 RepID=UPI001781AFE1|nr:PDZ and LIM domain protein Zasp isoform X1 [Rhagoletis pomonella]XP_036332793.1 PDZ and LIM domain protein Zasp isoform X1 [Rhagoletis pomonella]XP_036332794.1 PDZ and LIM domain protein Zasp isoform X1 [Rhagoletis pomonella]XP_036332795.1 PDZ and LIM domain protein Zasp isoform X1 [Rhagoletis pomonella]XP_036332797.1 PDZ and LIM domain protein Zasp isoform X1 [Rhagoletis pomonella]XP_036332798.1 PDZ and LIM domain protein Zasp isoform X1 [Rhagoletis pomonella]XP_036332799.1 PDZ and LIM do
MAQPQLLQIKLSRFDAQPWGFRLQGGVDFASPLVVQKVNGGSLAEKAGLIPGDAVLQINDVDVFNLRHKDAQDVVVRSGNNFVLTVQRGGSTWRPHVTPTGNLPQPQQNSPYLQTVTKTSLAHKQQEGQHIGCGYNNAARPFVNGGDGSVKSIVNKQYNTPVGIYSDESIAETLSAQAEVLAGGVLGVNFKKNEKEYQPDKSEVLKFLREEETGQSTPAFQQDYQHQHQNQHQHLHHQQQQPQQQQQQQQHYQPSATRHVSAPVNSSKPPSTGGLPTGQNICHECERLITGVFVRIKDKNLHVECFKCATCGTSLKNQGYYNYNNKLYCDIHAKLAALQNPPPGTDGYVPVPIKPNAKLSANTISSALNAHGFSDIPVANGGVATQNSVPRPQAYESANENKEDNTDLPLPPPPSPSLLQQLEIDSQYCAAVDDNTTDTKQKLLHISRHSTLSTSSNNSSRTSAAQPSHIPSMTEEISTAPMVDETSSGYTSASSLRSRQTSSAPSSVCGTSTDSNRTPIASPPPPPPLPPSLPVQMIQQPHRQPCENDMNSQNQHGIGGGLAGGVYSKFLKEYSNKLLTQNNKNNISTNSLSIDISSKSNHKHYEKSNKSLVTNNIQNRLNNTALPYHPSTQTLMTSHAQSVKNLDSIASGLISTTTDAVPGIDTASATTKNTHPSVIAISANFTNQLNPCQQVAKSATDSTLPPPALLSSTPKTEITSATLINAVNSNCHSHISNRCESAQLSEFEGIPDTAREATSAMLANQPSELDQSPFGEYVTLTGSVIRSVVPPGKGTNINYKVHQGYARPFGAASGAPASAPKSPVAYPPQRSAVNPYATLPRNNVGQQVQTESNTTSTSTYASNSTQASSSSYQSNAGTALSGTKIDLQEVIDETTEELEHSEVLFPPPSPLSHLQGKAVISGLHKADTIPKYQRNWTKLPTQSPVRTPEPSELRENIPLAFVDSPAANSSSNPVHKPVAQISTTTANESKRQEQSSLTEQRTKSQTQTKRPVVPVIVEDRVTPQVTMAFQSLDEHLQLDESQRPNRPYTPSISNKPVPIIPFYQTPEALCFDECPASHARTYDRRSASPFPDRARSPAPGPPPNPLAAIRTPRVKDNELSSLSPRILQAGSITTGQSYLGAQQQQQTEIISHLEQTSKTGSQSYTKIPERIQEHQIGNYTVQRREKASVKSDQKQSSLESQTKMQIGDTQIERRRRVTEEYEHTQSARSVEIRTGTKTTTVAPASSATERRQSYGKTGYVANQARRLSGLEQEITNLTSQSQAISARAAALTDTSFPQISSPEPVSKFPTKPLLPPHDEPKRPSYLFSATPYNKMVGPPPGFNEQENEQKQNQQQLSSFHALTTYGASMASKQQKSLSTYSSSNFTTSTSTASSLSQQANAANVGSLTKASITNNNQADAASATTAAASAICPVTGTFCRPGHTCCRQQQLQAQTIATGVVNYTENNNVTYRPNASTGITDIKTNAQTTATAIATAANAIAYATDTAPPSSSTGSAAAAAPTSFPPPNTIDNNKSNVALGGSTGVGGKGAFGATSAPKRGRGIFNKAVGPGVRVPLCNSCNIQIRGPFITALGRIWCPEHFICVNANCRRPLQDIGFVEEKGDLYCEYCFEKYLAPTCSKCGGKIKGDCLNAIGKQFHPECFTCGHCGKLFGNTPFFLEDGNAYCEADWNELFTTKCFACGFPVEAGDRWVEALNHNYHSQCFNCTYCKQNLEGQSFYNKGGRPFCKNHAR